MGFETDVTDQRQLHLDDEDKNYEIRLVSILPKEKRYTKHEDAYGSEVDDFQPYSEYGSEQVKEASEYNSEE